MNYYYYYYEYNYQQPFAGPDRSVCSYLFGDAEGLVLAIQSLDRDVQHGGNDFCLPVPPDCQLSAHHSLLGVGSTVGWERTDSHRVSQTCTSHDP